VNKAIFAGKASFSWVDILYKLPNKYLTKKGITEGNSLKK
jgi:hypothetical protein